ncbi:hypothetical protein [Fluviicola sp.]|uniref:hypothetical protein n=1 Tax=Fluviicola sp. TaxID=1917219 RepID=UPI003D27FC57
MMQINNIVLVAAIAGMKGNPAFLNFIINRKKSLTKLALKGEYKYETKDVTGKKIEITESFTDSNGFKPYVELLQTNIEVIITCDSIELKDWEKKFDKILLIHHNPDAIRGFYKVIEKKLNYSELRSGDDNLLFEFYSLLKVKLCVYCNSQHVILLQESKKARLQADHNLPKSKYPCFSVSLANLYPTCNNCNHHKSDDDVNYRLYYKDKPRIDFKFSIPELEIVDFFSSKIREETLTLNFDQGTTKLNDVLRITEIYANHKDYAADFMRKHKIYSKSYIDSLSATFHKLFGSNPDQLKRMIFGTTLNEQEINQRAFSKLFIDLNKQLDELKKSK